MSAEKLIFEGNFEASLPLCVFTNHDFGKNIIFRVVKGELELLELGKSSTKRQTIKVYYQNNAF